MSRRLLVVAAVVCTGLVLRTDAAWAKCARALPNLGVWPADVLEPEGYIVVEAAWASRAQTAVREAAALDLRLHTVDGKSAVPLDVIFAADGAVDSSQALLRPRWPLTVGEIYMLDLGDEQRRWTVVAPEPLAPPEWVGAPAVVMGQFERLGCGPSSHVLLTAPVDAPGELRLQVRATDVRAGTIQEQVVALGADGLLDVGRSMCGDRFYLRPHHRYSLEVWAIDTHGRRVASPGLALLVTGPGPVDLGLHGAEVHTPASWLYGLFLVALGFTLAGTFLAVRCIVRARDET